MRWMIALPVLAACGGAPVPPAKAPTPAKLADLGWLAGNWHAAMLDAHWEVVAGAFYGVALPAQGFEVNIIDDSDDDGKPAPITLFTAENGRDPMVFALTTATPQLIEFVDPQHRVVRLSKTDHGWRGEFTEQPGRHPIVFAMEPSAIPKAPELEAADREFDTATAKDGPDGWMRFFASDGAVWRAGGRVEGEAIRTAMQKTLAKGELRWTPVASGLRNDVGFTLGTWTFGPAGGTPLARGSYCTIWRKQPDETWKIVFDIGRPGD